ncbi:hypothetical protein AURDEDRAFT_156536 [Auricularia subglabra TFB-10046 SS5]|nr:hypothetical protein AURDEDRAFT_156536 [Auricularia subglabra TFB-10046 SS5]
MEPKQGSVQEHGPENLTHGAVSSLREDRTRGRPIWRAVAQALNARAPINSLPPELLCLIFSYLDETALYCTPTRICSQWRATALSHARLWSRIDVLSWHALAAIPTLLERSGSAPVDMELQLYRTDPARAVSVESCSAALAAHIEHIKRLHIFAYSFDEFDLVMGPAFTRSSSSLQSLTLCFTQFLGVTVTTHGFSALRSLATMVRLEPGDWMHALDNLILDYSITLEHLFGLLAHTSALKTLYIKQPVYSHPLPSELIDPRVRRLRLRDFICTQTHNWASIFADALSLSQVENIAALPMGPLVDAQPILFGSMGRLRAIALDRSGPMEPQIAFADVHGRRRLLSTNDSMGALLSQSERLRDVECMTLLTSRLGVFRNVVWDLRAVSLDHLRTVIFELPSDAVHGTLPDDQRRRWGNILTALPFHLPSGLPAFRDIVLIPGTAPRAGIALIDVVTALKIVDYLAVYATTPPRLRLANVRFAAGDGDGDRVELQNLQEKVACVVEESWDELICRRWFGMPEYAFGRGVTTAL